jgi:hypothetical protein
MDKMEIIKLCKEQSAKTFNNHLEKFKKQGLTQEQILAKLTMVMNLQLLLTTYAKTRQDQEYDMLVLASMVDEVRNYVYDVIENPQFDVDTFFETHGKRVYTNRWNRMKKKLEVVDLIVNPVIIDAIHRF